MALAASPTDVFTRIYKRDLWGIGAGMAGFGSGPGSSFALCEPLVNFLETYLTELKAAQPHASKSVLKFLDIGCGDMQWMPALLSRLSADIVYAGIDCVASVIDENARTHPHLKFAHVDFMSSSAIYALPAADVFFCKDVLQHYPSDVIVAFLTNLFARFPDAHVLVANCNYQATDERVLQVGGFVPLSGLHVPLRLFKPRALLSWHTKTLYRLFSPVAV
jgi:2-polyprenyl-3-methyl-5-hydroxy-6-metoxy-1,4-benzoquinol methylase